MPVLRASPAPEHFTSLGDLLRFLRRRAGLTQRELSIAVGYSESQISRVEQNERALDPALLAARFVPALQLDADSAWAARLLALGAAPPAHAPLPPAGEARLTPHNLPAPLTSFVGREREVAEIQHLLTPPVHTRLLTLTGFGGCGKTRLALQAAAGLAAAFPHGLWFVDLAPLTDPEFVPQAIAAVLGLTEAAERPRLAVVAEHLSRKRALVILDNCEHLIQASAQAVETLLQACPELCVLATSREILGIAGEHVRSVASLSLPAAGDVEALRQSDAVRLFCERAAAVVPDFALTPATAPAVARICQRLDGIPLALELAAARLRRLPVAEIAARLDDVFRLLTGGSRTALPRHQTLQALMDWSHELLLAEEQIVFRRLGVFAGGWTVAAAEAVCADGGVEPDALLELMGRLIDKSLVAVDSAAAAGAGRYRMLETIRQYALGKLAASGEADVVRRRHVMYFLKLAETDMPDWLTTPMQPAWLDRIECDYDNLRAALTWSLATLESADLGLRLTAALTSYWGCRGQAQEQRNWLETALAHVAEIGVQPTPIWAFTLQALGDVVGLQGDYTAGQALVQQALRLFRELGDLHGAAWALNLLGRLARDHGDAVAARRRLEESAALHQQTGDQPGVAWATMTLGEVAIMQEDAAWAAQALEASLAWFRESGELLGLGWAHNHLGHVAQLNGDFQRAADLHAQSLAFFDQIGPAHLGTLWAHQSLGETALGTGKPALAAAEFSKALTLADDLGHRDVTAWCLAGLAGAAALTREPERAAWLWGAAEARRQAAGARPAPAARATHERLQAAVRAQLGAAAFAEHWAAGQAASLEQALARALGDDLAN